MCGFQKSLGLFIFLYTVYSILEQFQGRYVSLNIGLGAREERHLKGIYKGEFFKACKNPLS
jgi:hypothetical protein